MKNWLRILSTALLAGALLGGCSGDDGAAGAPGAPGAPGATGARRDRRDLRDRRQGRRSIVAKLTAEEWAALTITGKVTSASIASPTVVSFSLADASGRPIVGIGNRTSTSGGVTSYSNIRFELAKLVAGTAGSPDEWISYIVQDNAGVPTRPTTDQNGTLVDNGDGTYVYTFARDIPEGQGPGRGGDGAVDVEQGRPR